MNTHLSLAREYIGKGEEFYRKAAEEILAARDEDDSLSWREVAESVGKSRTWCQNIVSWYTSGQAPDTPFARVEGETERKDKSATVKTLRESSPEQIAEILADPKIAENVTAAQSLAQPWQRPEPAPKKQKTAWDQLSAAADQLTAASQMAHWTEWHEDPYLLESDLAAETCKTMISQLSGILRAIESFGQSDQTNDEFFEIVRRNFTVVS